MLLKDLGAALAGVRRTEGSRYLAGHVDERDSELVRRYKRAGLLILGKTSTAELGNCSSTVQSLAECALGALMACAMALTSACCCG